MSNDAILAASGLLLVAYGLDRMGRRFRVPSVVLLILAGLAARRLLDAFDLHYRWIEPLVPVVGTLGLILIVLEGALDLKVTRERAGIITTAAASAVLGFVICVIAFALLFAYLLDFAAPAALLSAVPFAVISSAVAIPSAVGLRDKPHEFIVYESSLSDILGVLVFYAWLAAAGSLEGFAADLLGDGTLSVFAALVSALILFYFINQIAGQVRFLPLLAGLVFLYAIGKAVHLSPLVFVLVCGLIINNPQLITWHARLRSIKNDSYEQTLKEFKGLVAELTFATKSFFFLLLGYWTDVGQMWSVEAWLVAVAGIAFIVASRWVLLTLLRQEGVAQLVWIAPRGLITVLLFLSARDTGELDGFPFGAVMLVVLLTSAMTALAHRGSGHVEGTGEGTSEFASEAPSPPPAVPAPGPPRTPSPTP